MPSRIRAGRRDPVRWPRVAPRPGRRPVDDAVFELGVPILGICYGMQALAAKFGGKVRRSDHREFGYAEVDARGRRIALLEGLSASGRPLKVWMSHGDRVERLPPRLRADRGVENAPLAGMADRQRRIYGLQFHPEVTHTEQGLEIIRRFVTRDLRLPGDLDARQNIIAEHIERVRARSATSACCSRFRAASILPSSPRCCMRRSATSSSAFSSTTGCCACDEGDQVMATFAEHLGVNVIGSNAEELFLERARRRRGPRGQAQDHRPKFIEVFEREAAKLDDVRWLAQGTIYPDVIESAGAATGKAHLIKSHHNVGGLPERMQLKLDRAAAGLVQGRGAQDRRRARLCRASWSTGIRFRGPGSACGYSVPSNKEYADLLRRADRYLHRGAAERTGSTTRSARRSRCSCPSNRSASWVTGAATTTWSRCAPSRPSIS